MRHRWSRDGRFDARLDPTDEPGPHRPNGRPRCLIRWTQDIICAGRHRTSYQRPDTRTGPRAALFRSAGRDAGAPGSAPKPTVSSMRAMGITPLLDPVANRHSLDRQVVGDVAIGPMPLARISGRSIGPVMRSGPAIRPGAAGRRRGGYRRGRRRRWRSRGPVRSGPRPECATQPGWPAPPRPAR